MDQNVLPNVPIMPDNVPANIDLLYPIRCYRYVIPIGETHSVKCGWARNILFVFSANPVYPNVLFRIGNSGDSIPFPTVARHFFRSSGFRNFAIINNSAAVMTGHALVSPDPRFTYATT